MCFAIDIAEQRSRLHAHRAQLRVDGNLVQRREVDDNAIIAQGPPGDVVTAAFDRDEKIVSARENFAARTTSAGSEQRKIRPGCLSMLAFQIRRAES
jgi:hypothetical protein